MSKIRKRLNPNEAKILDLKIKPNEEGRSTARYFINKQEWQKILEKRKGKVELSNESETVPNDYNMGNKTIMSARGDNGEMMNIDEYCNYYNLPRKDISSYKLVSHTGIPFFNIVFKENIVDVQEEIDFFSLFKDKIKRVKVDKIKKPTLNGVFDRLVYTDTHIGMEPNEGFSQYGGKWDEEELEDRLEKIINWVVSYQTSNTLYIDDLGDFMDGWNGFTTRGGHVLPQNMDNQKAYDIGLSFKVRMIDSLSQHYEKIYCRNVCNNNHGGAFDYVVNSAFKTIAELKYPEIVEVFNQRKFIDHYTIETEGYNFTFITSHGKDEKEKKFGFNPKLKEKDQIQIDGYINENFLHQKDTVIQFDKGDTHLELYDFSTAYGFYYLNHPALSPSSNYIQTNYQKGRSGFGFFNYREDEKMPIINPKHFDWIK